MREVEGGMRSDRGIRRVKTVVEVQNRCQT